MFRRTPLPGSPSPHGLMLQTFRAYIDSKRTFLAVAEACTIKGWPDRAATVRAAFRMQHLFCDQELMRFGLLVAIHVPGGESPKLFSSIGSISHAIHDNWTDVNERSLEQRNPTYASILAEISNCRAAIAQEALEEPLKMAGRDPEYLKARTILQESLRECDKALATIGLGVV